MVRTAASDLETRIKDGSIPPHKRNGYLDSLYVSLKRNLGNESEIEIRAAVRLLSKYSDFRQHAFLLDYHLAGRQVDRDLREVDKPARGLPIEYVVLPKVFVHPPIKEEGQRLHDALLVVANLTCNDRGHSHARLYADEAKEKIETHLNDHGLPPLIDAEKKAMSGCTEDVYRAFVGYLGRAFRPVV